MHKHFFALIAIAIILYIPLTTAEPATVNDSVTNITSRFSASLDQPVQLPNAIETLVKVVLGIKQSPTLTITLLVASACIWLFLFMVLAEVLHLTPFFNGVTRWIGAVIITLLIAVTGVIESITLSLLSFTLHFWFFEDWSVGALSFIVVVFIFGGFALSKVLRQAKEYNEKVRAHLQGINAGANDAFVEEQRKM